MYRKFTNTAYWAYTASRLKWSGHINNTAAGRTPSGSNNKLLPFFTVTQLTFFEMADTLEIALNCYTNKGFNRQGGEGEGVSGGEGRRGRG